MACSPDTTNLLHRRALVTFFTGVAVAGNALGAAAPAFASTPDYHEADVQLFASWLEYVKSECELLAAQDARDLVSWNARKAYPPKPDCMANGWMKIMASEIEAEVEVWERRCNQINIRFGLPELESDFKKAWDKQWAAFARFVATPATTLVGLALKTSAIFYFEEATRRAWRGSASDQENLEPEHQILLALRRDLLRMAGLPDDFAMEYAEANDQYIGTAE